MVNFCHHTRTKFHQKCSKIVFSRVWIITFKVRSLAQSDQTRRVITTFTPVWPGFEPLPSFFFLFRKNFHSAQKLLCTIFSKFPLRYFCSFHARVDLQAFENWSRVHNRPSDRRNYIRGSLLSIGPPSNIDFLFTSMTMIRRHRGLVFYKSWADIGPRANRKRPRSSARKRWLEGMVGDRGCRMNSKRVSRFLFARRGRVQGIVYGSIL